MDIKNVKRLSYAEYQQVKNRVYGLIKDELGPKPTREALRREQQPLLDILDWMGIIVFIAAFVVSSLHVFHYIEKQASVSWDKMEIHQSEDDSGDSPGIMKHFTKDSYVTISQIGMIFLAEISMILFMTVWRRDTKDVPVRRRFFIPISHINPPIVLAVLAMVFILTANINSGLNLLEALMPPLFTIGLGFQLEKVVDELLNRRKDLTYRFLDKVSSWEKYFDDPETHPKYKNVLMQTVWEKILSKKENAQFSDASSRVKYQIVMQEIDRDLWVQEETAVAKLAEEKNIPVEELPQSEGERFYMTLCDAIDSGSKSSVSIGRYSANLSDMTWTSPDGVKHGPYKNRGMMKMSVTAHLKSLNKNKASSKVEKTVVGSVVKKKVLN